jgi:DNA-binding MarR family transcriptional regulator
MGSDPSYAIERAMSAIRRRQTRRVISRNVERDGVVNIELLDAIDAGCETANDVANYLRMDKPRVSKLIDAAEAANLVERKPDLADRRRAILSITDEGRVQMDASRQHRRDYFDRATLTWSAEDRQTFADLLTRFVADLERV